MVILDALLRIARERFPDKQLIGTSELAEIFECDIKVVQNWLRRSTPDRRPPRIKLGHEFRFPRDEVVRWVIETQSR